MSKEQDAKREALAKAARAAAGHGDMSPWDSLAVADFILALQAEREGPLVEYVTFAATHVGAHHESLREMARNALARHRALDAPPQRTLAEVAKDALQFLNNQSAIAKELADALKREEGKR